MRPTTHLTLHPGVVKAGRTEAAHRGVSLSRFVELLIEESSAPKDGKVSTKPATPFEIEAAQVSTIPDVVFEAVNALLAARWTPGVIVLYQKDVITEIGRRDAGLTGKVLIERHALDFESAYRKQGWHVTYEKPDFNGEGDAFWRFQPA